MNEPTISSTELLKLTGGVTYRQLDYWRRIGAIVPVDGRSDPGSGSRTQWSHHRPVHLARARARRHRRVRQPPHPHHRQHRTTTMNDALNPLALDIEHPDWYAFAECRGLTTAERDDIFFPPRGAASVTATVTAKAIVGGATRGAA